MTAGRHVRRRWTRRAKVTVTVPIVIATMAISVQLATAGNSPAVTAPPAVTSLSPTTGPTSGGTVVTITGTNFTGATSVLFGGVGGSNLTVVNATTVTAKAPADTAGAHNVQVITPLGASPKVTADLFTYAPPPAVTSLSPTTGPTSGGTTITITGTNFTGATAVLFGGIGASSFVVTNATTITAKAPADTAGAHNVQVTTPLGTSPKVTADLFTYAAPPTVTSLSPTAGPISGGTTVTITGTNFTGATAVLFGGIGGSNLTVVNATTITVKAPADTAGAHNVQVTTPLGTSPKVTADLFTYGATPAVTSLSPTTGPTSGGTAVTITGTNLSGATAVNFGATAASAFVVNSATTITATAPTGSGTVDVTVTTGGGTSATSAADHFSYVVPLYSIPSPVAGGWQLNGSSTLNTAASPANLELTPATNYEAGSAFWPIPVPGVGASISFDEFIGSGSGADGLTLTLADASVTAPTALGVNGGGEGFSGITGIAVSMDTWKNAINPSNNFVGIANGGVPGASNELNYVATNITVPTLENTVHHFVVTTTSTGITVTMDGTQVLNYATSLPPYVLVGFTAGTGGFSDVHQVQNVVITTGPPSLVPTVTGVSPNSGPTTGGTVVTLTGGNFTGANGVSFGSSAASSFAVVNATTITATAPPGSGTADVTVTTPGGKSVTSAADLFTYTVPPAPTVTAISPNSGPIGTSVTITGTNFSGATGVSFGSSAASSFVVTNATTITAAAPTGSGAVDVTVTTGGGTSPISAVDKFSYVVLPPTVTGVSPTSGPSGTAVTITGTNLSGATAVNFGATAASAFVVNSATTITATAPTGSGTVDVTVTTGGGTSTTSAADRFGFVVPLPTVTGATPNSGPSGTAVTITGTNLSGATAVRFGATAASGFVVNSATTITATAPTGSGTVDVTVTTGGGTSTTSAADHYTYATGPSPYSIPSPVAGGWQLNGSATLNTAASPANLELTPATNWQAGSAFWPVPVPGVGASISFDEFIGSGSGADGLTLTLADASVTAPTALGVNGGGEGFSGTTGIAVSMDTWQNAVNPSNNFVGIANGGVPGASQELNYVATNTTVPPLENVIHHFVVTTTSTGITVTMDGTQVLNYATTLPPYVLVGFTAGTGGFSDVHEVQNVVITTGPPSLVPTVTSVSPNSGPNTGGTTVTITGGNFTDANGVDFGPANPADSFVINSPTSITATTPAGTGTVDVTVTTPGGTNAPVASDQFTFTVPPRPTVTGISPNSGPTSGGPLITITGTNFDGATFVDFGPANPASDFDVINSTTITAPAPSGGLGTFDVTVFTPGGSSGASAADQYTYVAQPAPAVTGISPASGPSTGGTVMAITGTGFTDASTVYFGAGSPSSSFTVNSDTSITATAPAGTLGAVDVTVQTPGGTSATSPADQFSYVAPTPPVVTGVSPNTGPNGTQVAITGTALTGATAVNFGPGHPATFTVNSATTIYATVPVGTGIVDVTVTAPGGTSATTPGDQYSYSVPSAATVTSLSPSAGFTGTSVIVTGTRFTGASAVNFGSTTAAFTVNSDTSITATVPGGTGSVDVTIVTSGGTSAINAADQFSYLAGPTPPTEVATYRGPFGTGYYPAETGLTTANAATLKLHWTDTGSAGSYAQPIVANNMVYWGDWNGLEHATTLSGTDVWTRQLGVNTDASCLPAVAGVSGTATVAQEGSTSVIYVPGGDDNLYAMNALTGAVIWQTSLGTPPADYLWASPVLYNGSIYEAVASFGDCPLVQGRLVQLDALTGTIQHTADMVPNGCIGGGIWASPVVDPSDGSIYVTTGTPNGCGSPELSPAIVKLRASDLTILSSWTVPPSELYSDPDFGATPTLFTAVINGVPRSLVGALDKNGLFYAWDRTNLAAGPVWQARIADPAGGPLSITSASWDGTRLYVGGGNAIVNGTSCYQNISALNPATGAFIWRTCVQGSMTAGITEVPGVLIEGYGAVGKLLFLNTANGATLFSYSPGAVPEGEATVSNGIVYVSLTNGNLIALGQ